MTEGRGPGREKLYSEPGSVIVEPEAPRRHVHDRGGWHDAGPIDWSEHELAPWEQEIRALYRLLKNARGLVTTDELRRGIEGLSQEEYETLGYFERWVRSLETILIEKGVFTREELGARWEEE